MFKTFNKYFNDKKTVRLTFTDSLNSQQFIRRIIRPLTIKNKEVWQIESLDSQQAFHKNVPLDELLRCISRDFSNSYRNMLITNLDETISFSKLKNGKTKIDVKKNPEKLTILKSHDREKEYILPEGTQIPALVDLGVFATDYKVVKSKYDKFRQINRFLEIIADEIPEKMDKPFTIIDFGSGKSYLTFVLYYYFRYILDTPVKIYGYDLKEEVVKDCNNLAEKYGYDDLEFIYGDIRTAFDKNIMPDMIVTLHACDIATDIALYHSIINKVPFIFSVPCCQHEVNSQILAKDELSLILKDGLFKDRFSAILTDVIRVETLRLHGYKTDVIEFVDFENTPKNVMIRAVRGKSGKTSEKDLSALLKRFGISHTLINLLSKQTDSQTLKPTNCHN